MQVTILKNSCLNPIWWCKEGPSMHFSLTLPPLAADYSGAASMFYDLGGTILINGADGCLSSYAGYDEPRYFSKKSVLLSSGLRAIRAIFGDEDFLIKTLPDIEALKNSRFFLLLSSPAASVIGTDHEAVARAVEEKTGVPSFFVPTTGMETYEIGASRAMLAIAKRFIRPRARAKRSALVNLLGLSPLDYWGRAQTAAIYRAVYDSGYEIQARFGADGSIDDIEAASAADFNIVLSVSGLETARYLEKTWGMPYYTGAPVGKHISANWIAFLRGELPAAAQIPLPKTVLLIIGQQIWCNAFREGLELEYRGGVVRVLSLFRMEPALMREGDAFLENEAALIGYIRENPCDIAFGDPLFAPFFPPRVRYVPIPHAAVSSRLHWFHNTPYVGSAALEETMPKEEILCEK
jgi:hypothetical protein